MKAKLGQQITFTQERRIKLAKGGTVLIKTGDTARVVKKIDDSTGEIVYLSGEAKGMSQQITMEVDDNLDVDSILKKVMNGLNS
jgi:hypothetical protein